LTIRTSTLETETVRLRATLRPTCSRLSETVDVLRDSSPDAQARMSEAVRRVMYDGIAA